MVELELIWISVPDETDSVVCQKLKFLSSWWIVNVHIVGFLEHYKTQTNRDHWLFIFVSQPPNLNIPGSRFSSASSLYLKSRTMTSMEDFPDVTPIRNRSPEKPNKALSPDLPEPVNK